MTSKPKAYTQERDRAKDDYAARSGLRLLRVPFSVVEPEEIKRMIERGIYGQ